MHRKFLLKDIEKGGALSKETDAVNWFMIPPADSWKLEVCFKILCLTFCFAGSPQLSKAVKRAKILFRLWRKEIPKIPDIFILFHYPQSLAITIDKNFFISTVLIRSR